MEDVLLLVGVIQVIVVVLSIFAGLLCFKLILKLKNIEEKRRYSVWKDLLFVLLLFGIGEIVGILDAFNIMREISFLRHIIPSFLLIFLIIAMVKQIDLARSIENE